MSSYTVGTSPNEIDFTFTTNASGNVVNIRSDNESDNELIVALFGYPGITFTPGITVPMAQAIADAIFANLL